jgi:hypothetical protein
VHVEQLGSQLQVIAGAISLDLLDDELGVSFHEELLNLHQQGCTQPKEQGFILCMLLVALKSRCTIYLNWSPCGARISTPAPATCLREESSKKRVQWGPVKTGALGSGSLSSGPPRGLADGVQSTMKSTSTWS